MESIELVPILNTYFNWNKCRMHCFVGMLVALIKCECAAILDIGLKLGLFETEKLNDARNLLFRMVSMLIKMVRSAH